MPTATNELAVFSLEGQAGDCTNHLLLGFSCLLLLLLLISTFGLFL